MATQIKLRRGTAAQWTESNPTLAAGEAGFETDTNQLKIGNGTDNWAALDYISSDLTPYLTIASASATYVPLSDTTLVTIDDEQTISANKTFTGWVNLYSPYGTPGTDSGIGRIEYNYMSDRLQISAYESSTNTGGQMNLFATNDIILYSQDGEVYLTSSASANQIATLGNLEAKEDKVLSVPSERTSAFTVALSDANNFIRVNGTYTISVPTDATVNFPVGSQITFLNSGSGTITFAPSTPGTTVVNGTPGLKLRTTWSSATLIKYKNDAWVLIGDLIA